MYYVMHIYEYSYTLTMKSIVSFSADSFPINHMETWLVLTMYYTREQQHCPTAPGNIVRPTKPKLKHPRDLARRIIFSSLVCSVDQMQARPTRVLSFSGPASETIQTVQVRICSPTGDVICALSLHSLIWVTGKRQRVTLGMSQDKRQILSPPPQVVAISSFNFNNTCRGPHAMAGHARCYHMKFESEPAIFRLSRLHADKIQRTRK